MRVNMSFVCTECGGVLVKRYTFTGCVTCIAASANPIETNISIKTLRNYIKEFIETYPEVNAPYAGKTLTGKRRKRVVKDINYLANKRYNREHFRFLDILNYVNRLIPSDTDYTLTEFVSTITEHCEESLYV